ncbi:hypothetical protein [Geodermatophilus marinus]|uniref:hypothetical protein n=1 Tax=Geodermatophilus sp. LHW52908 TaxID=2303986 RepID=UPI0011C0D0E9|nr:hypothetical protein [Geodermatophilus sp. LHW52908]
MGTFGEHTWGDSASAITSNPINYVDPTGRDVGGTIGSIIGGVAGVIAGAAICAGTAGVGCIAGAAFAGSALTTAGGLIGSGFANEDISGLEVVSWSVGGAATGAASGVAKLLFP